MVALFRVTDVPPLTALKEAEAPQPLKLGETGLARKTFAGRVSVREACVRVVLKSLFAITMDSWLVWPAQIVLGLKLLATVGG